MKSDRSIRNICIAAIKRHTIGPIDFAFVRIFETEPAPQIHYDLAFLDGELPITHTFIDTTNWTLVTTRRVICCDRGECQESSAESIESWNWGIFNVVKDKPVSTGELKLDNGNTMKIHIELGKASMITIYAIMTLVGQIRKIQ